MIFSSTRPMTAPERLAAWYAKAASLGIIATGPRWACWPDYAYGAYERSETGVYRGRF